MASSPRTPDNVTSVMAPSEYQKKFPMRPSLETAVHWFDGAGLVLVGALAIGVICTIIIVLMGIVKEGHWDEAREEHKLEIARLGAEGEKAKAEVEKAHADIAAANKAIEQARADTAIAVADTAKANERTAELKLALEEEVAARQPRIITAEQHAEIVAYLRTTTPKGAVVVVWKQFDEEAIKFGKQVVAVLKDAGFDATEGRGPMAFGQSRGAWIVVRDLEKFRTPSAFGSIQSAFRDILHMEFGGIERKDPFPDLGEAVIAIGAKP